MAGGSLVIGTKSNSSVAGVLDAEQGATHCLPSIVDSGGGALQLTERRNQRFGRAAGERFR
jgi:hypothetical protein